MDNSNQEKEYWAIIWTSDPSQSGLRVSVWALSLEQAKSILESKYGKGTVYNLHNEEASNRIR